MLYTTFHQHRRRTRSIPSLYNQANPATKASALKTNPAIIEASELGAFPVVGAGLGASAAITTWHCIMRAMNIATMTAATALLQAILFLRASEPLEGSCTQMTEYTQLSTVELAHTKTKPEYCRSCSTQKLKAEHNADNRDET